ncbi:MAG: hypothetical protein KJ906_02490 [Nanoarchaeota archaeon]|nr:hypothetical protein [Nanoarchaeota archaeon]
MNKKTENPYDKIVNMAANHVKQQGYAYSSCIGDIISDNSIKIFKEILKPIFIPEIDAEIEFWETELGIAIYSQLEEKFRNYEGLLLMSIPDKYFDISGGEDWVYAFDFENLKKGYENYISYAKEEINKKDDKHE